MGGGASKASKVKPAKDEVPFPSAAAPAPTATDEDDDDGPPPMNVRGVAPPSGACAYVRLQPSQQVHGFYRC